METQRVRLTCHSCGKGVEGSPGKLPCEVLKDWITVSRWKGPGAVLIITSAPSFALSLG